MTFLSEGALQEVRRDPPGLELQRYWRRTAGTTSVPARALLSHLAAGLVSRGWIQPVDKLLDSAAETLSEPRAVLRGALDELIASDLLTLADDGQRVLTLGGLLSTRPTGLLFYVDHDHTAHLVGPLAGLAVAQAMQLKGEVRATCPVTKQKLVLSCDTAGIDSRNPETIALFLPAWDGAVRPTVAMAGGGFFADDESLGRWQEDNGDPAGMPLASFMFPMAATDLGQELGAALEAVLGHLPDFS